MAEFDPNERVAPWLEAELKQELRPVEAPLTLWSEVRRGTAAKPRGASRFGLLAIAAGIFLAASSVVVLRATMGRHPRTQMEKLAVQDLRRLLSGSGVMDLRSHDPGEIRAWVKARTSLDLDLPEDASPSRSLQLLGARVLQVSGEPVAAVEYRVDGDFGALLVAKAHGSAGVSHRHVAWRGDGPGERLSSWNAREQAFTIAFSGGGEANRACLVCHADLALASF